MKDNKDYTQGIDLFKLKNVVITECKGRTQTKKGIFIPIDDNDLQVSLDENLKVKKVFLNFVNWALNEEGKYGDTHITKQAFSEEFRSQLTEEELKQMPILGSMKPIKKAALTIEAQTEVEAIDSDMPF